MDHNFETLAHLRNFVNSLSEDELKQPLRFWGDEIGGLIYSATILQDDQINPSGECCEDRSGYMPGGEHYDPDFEMEDEPIVLSKGAVIFQVDTAPGMNRYFKPCPTCGAPCTVSFGGEEALATKNYRYAGK